MQSAVRALAAWGLTSVQLEPLSGGAVNQHWAVTLSDGSQSQAHPPDRLSPSQPDDPRSASSSAAAETSPASRTSTAGPQFVLRRYSERHLVDSIPYEHAVLAFLAELDWPVAIPAAAPIGAADCGTLLVNNDGVWALFPFLEGATSSPSPTVIRRKAATLALLHRDLIRFPNTAQRLGFASIDDLDAYTAPDGHGSMAALLRKYETLDSDRSRALKSWIDANQRALEQVGYAGLPRQPIHWDFGGTGNILFTAGDVSGILDFDFAHLDSRMVDVARSIVGDIATVEAAPELWLHAYSTFAEPGVTPAEARALPALMMAAELWNTVLPLSIGLAGGPDWMLSSVRGSIDHRLPLIEALAA